MLQNNPLVLVTGASQGIGAAVCQIFSRKGWFVVGCSRRAPKTFFGDVFSTCDVSHPEEVKHWVTSIGSQYGPISCLVNNAGIAGKEPFMDPDQHSRVWEDVLKTNLFGPYYSILAALPFFSEEGGAIVNVLSLLSHEVTADQPAYCAAKHGLLGLTQSLALTLAARKILVNGVSPGWVKTSMAMERFQDLNTTLESIEKESLLGSITSPEEVAQMIYLLGSRSFPHMTGQSIRMT